MSSFSDDWTLSIGRNDDFLRESGNKSKAKIMINSSWRVDS